MCGFTAFAAAKLLRKGFSDMAKYMNIKTLSVLCWITAGLQIAQSLLQYFFSLIVVLGYASVIIFALTLACAAGYFLTQRPAVHPGADIILLLFMFLYFVLSCVAMGIKTGENWFDLNSEEMADMEVLIIIYLLGRSAAANGFSKVLKVVFHAFMAVWTAVTLFILILVFGNSGFVPPCGGYIGMVDSFSLQINCNRNFTGALSMTMLIICLIVAFAAALRSVRGLYIAYSVIYYVMLILSNSKTALIAGVFGFALIIGVIFVTSQSHRDKKAGTRILIFASAFIISGALFFLMRYPVYKLYSLVVSEAGGIPMDARDMLDSNVATVSNRTPIWLHSLEVIFTPRLLLTGVTPAGVADALIEAFGGYMQAPPHCHNLILQVGASLGIPGLLAFLAWLTLVALRCLKILTDSPFKRAFMLVTGLILAIMLDNMAERYSMFYMFFISYPFFFACGYVMGYEKAAGAVD